MIRPMNSSMNIKRASIASRRSVAKPTRLGGSRFRLFARSVGFPPQGLSLGVALDDNVDLTGEKGLVIVL